MMQDNGGRYKIVHEKSVLRYQTIQDTTERYKKVRVSTVPDDTRYYQTIQDTTERYKIVQGGTVLDATRGHRTIQDSTSRYGTIRYQTIRY